MKRTSSPLRSVACAALSGAALFLVALLCHASFRHASPSYGQVRAARLDSPVHAPMQAPVPQRILWVVPASGSLDINTASPAELKALPGMGDVYVKRIIEGRPYTAKNQLVTRGILPQAAYERIRESIVAHRPPRT